MIHWICDSPSVSYTRTVTVTLALVLDIYNGWTFFTTFITSIFTCGLIFIMQILVNKTAYLFQGYSSTLYSVAITVITVVICLFSVLQVHCFVLGYFNIDALVVFIFVLFCFVSVTGNSKRFKDFLNSIDLSDVVLLQEEAIDKTVIVLDMGVCFIICLLAYHQSSLINYCLALLNAVPPLIKIYSVQMTTNQEWVTVYRRLRSLSARKVSSLDDICPICLTKMSSCKQTACGHNFHSSCLQKCLRQKLTCPVCRTCMCMRKTCPSLCETFPETLPGTI